MDITATQGLPDIDDTQHRGTEDHACFEEVRAVLARHGNLRRFGLVLLHEHFALAGDEVLVESCDSERRTLTIRPMKTSEVEAGSVVETQWRLDVDAVMGRCMQICTQDRDGRHIGKRTHLKY